MQAIAIVQARMTSKRLPGKVLRTVSGRPLLEHMLQRLQRSRRLAAAVVATSAMPEDDPIAAFCSRACVACVRGPLDDVAARFLLAFEKYPADAYVRLCGDSPWMDAGIVDDVVALYEQAAPDLATNVFPRTFPAGLSVEVFAPEFFRGIYACFTHPAHFEHITSYIYDNAAAYHIENYALATDAHQLDLSVNTPAQWEQYAALLDRVGGAWRDIGWQALIRHHAALRADRRSP